MIEINVLIPFFSLGYVGPAGIGLIGVLIAVVLVVLVGVLGLVLYPMRVMMRRKKLREQNAAAGKTANASPAAAPEETA
jgi:Tfp pilus assembly protein PilV